MEDRYTFTKEGSDGSVIKYEFDALMLSEILENFEYFLKGCAFHFTGVVDIVTEEDDFPVKSNDEEDDYTKEEIDEEVHQWFSDVRKIAKSLDTESSSGDKEENFDLKDCFSVQDKLTVSDKGDV